MGCRTEPVAVHIAHVLQQLHFFQFFNFLYSLHDLLQKKIPRPHRKEKSIFFIIHTTYSQKKIARLDNFFAHDLHFSPPKVAVTVVLKRALFPEGFMYVGGLYMIETSTCNALCVCTVCVCSFKEGGNQGMSPGNQSKQAKTKLRKSF